MNSGLRFQALASITIQLRQHPLEGDYQRWSRGHKARCQGHKKNPRPRPSTAFPRTDTLEAKDRNAQGQGPRTQAQVLSKKEKVFTKIFQAISTKKRFPKNFSSAPRNFNFSKNSAVLEPRTGQGLDLRGQGRGQGLQNVSLRTSSRPRTSSRTPPLFIGLCLKISFHPNQPTFGCDEVFSFFFLFFPFLSFFFFLNFVRPSSPKPQNIET